MSKKIIAASRQLPHDEAAAILPYSFSFYSTWKSKKGTAVAFCRFIWQRLSLCRGCAQQDNNASRESSILCSLLLVLQDTYILYHGWKSHPRITLRSLWIQSSCHCSFAGACLSCPCFCKMSAGWWKWSREEELEPVVCSVAPRGISEPGEEASPLQTVPSPFLCSSEPHWWCLATL